MTINNFQRHHKVPYESSKLSYKIIFRMHLSSVSPIDVSKIKSNATQEFCPCPCPRTKGHRDKKISLSQDVPPRGKC